MFRVTVSTIVFLIFSTSADFYSRSKLNKNFGGYWGNDDSTNIIPSWQSSQFGTWNTDTNLGRDTLYNPYRNIIPPTGNEKKLNSWTFDNGRPPQENFLFSKDDDFSTEEENAFGSGFNSLSNWDLNAGNNDKRPDDDRWSSTSFVPRPNEKETTSHPPTWNYFHDSNLLYEPESDGKSEIRKSKNQKKKGWNQNTNFVTTVKKPPGTSWSAMSSTTPGYIGVESNKRNPTQSDRSKKNGHNNRRITTNKGWDSAATIRPGNRYTTTVYNSFRKTTENPIRKGTSTSSFKDLTILDDLDKNEWYFYKESDFPEIDENSNVKIDLEELWDFDKRSSPKKSNNQRRRNREARKDVSCECVNVDLCNEEDVIMTVSNGELDSRNFNKWECEKLTDVCCAKSRTVAEQEDEIFSPLTCGHTGTGSEAKQQEYGEFPWILNLGTPNEELNCSASLIQPQLALTAAHCVVRIVTEPLFVKSGISLIDASFQVRKVNKIIVHPNHNEENPRNDVALLVLQKPFDLNGNINTICLPGTNDKWDSSNCVLIAAAAWTRDKNWLKVKKRIVRFLPQSLCQSIMVDERHQYVLHDSFVCGVDKNGENLCWGFEGSPIMCPSITFPNSYVQIGLVSRDANCYSFGVPALFTNIIKFIDWTNEIALDLDLFEAVRVQNLN